MDRAGTHAEEEADGAETAVVGHEGGQERNHAEEEGDQRNEAAGTDDLRCQRELYPSERTLQVMVAGISKTM